MENYRIKNLVEAMGVEPMSEMPQILSTTCVFFVYTSIFAPKTVALNIQDPLVILQRATKRYILRASSISWLYGCAKYIDIFNTQGYLQTKLLGKQGLQKRRQGLS